MTNQQEWFNIQKVINECVMDESLFIFGGGGEINFKYLVISYHEGVFLYSFSQKFWQFFRYLPT